MYESEIRLKTSLEVNRIKRSCRLIENILNDLEQIINTGISTNDVAAFCGALIKEGCASSSAFEYNGFPATICTSVNNIAVHGVPGNNILNRGDILTVDISLNIDGWHGDSARTYLVGKAAREAVRLQKAALSATVAGIHAAKAGNRLGDIGYAIEKTAHRWGCSVIEKFAGHGIGIKLHEEPLILPTGKKKTGIRIVPGMVFTIEPVLTLGSGEVTPLGDGWSFITKDGSLAAQYEHTIAVFSNRTEVLTKAELSFNY